MTEARSEVVAGALRRVVHGHPRIARIVRPAHGLVRDIRRSWTSSSSAASASWADFARERAPASGTILIVDDKVPEFDRHAGGAAMSQYVRLLVEHGFKVVFLPDDRYPRQPYTRTLQRAGVEVLHGHLDVDRWLAVHGGTLDWVMLVRPSIAPFYTRLVRRRTRARLLYFTVDLHYLRELRRYETVGDPAALLESRRLQPIEEALFRDADAVVTPSVAEVPLIRSLARGRPVRSIPLYALRMDPTDGRPEPVPAEREGVIFVGGYAHPPNVDAARFLVDVIMPMVWRDVPDTEVLLAGSDPTPEVQALAGPRVSVLGFVPDLDPYLARARVSVNPLRFGAGIKGKIVASLQGRVPVVTTTIGNEGLGLAHGVEALIDDTPEGLAANVVRLLRDRGLGRSLGEAGYRFVVERFHEERTRDGLFGALGLVVCPVCGRRSRRDGIELPDDDGGPRPPCDECGADAADARLADIVVRPYRRYRAPSIREALLHLAPVRIAAHEIGAPVRRHLAACPAFRGDRASDGDDGGGVDLMVAGPDALEVSDRDAHLEAIIRCVGPRGRLALVTAVSRDAGDDGSWILDRLVVSGFRTLSHRGRSRSDEAGLLAIEAVRVP